jgi:hypothetical protein
MDASRSLTIKVLERSEMPWQAPSGSKITARRGVYLQRHDLTRKQASKHSLTAIQASKPVAELPKVYFASQTVPNPFLATDFQGDAHVHCSTRPPATFCRTTKPRARVIEKGILPVCAQYQRFVLSGLFEEEKRREEVRETGAGRRRAVVKASPKERIQTNPSYSLAPIT